MTSGSTFSEYQTRELARRAISADVAEAAGVMSISHQDELPEGCPDYWTVENGYLPGLLYPWFSPTTETVELQLKPDVPVTGAGKPKKYVFGPDAQSILNQPQGHEPGADYALLVEGTNQTIAAAHYAPPEAAVYGIAGCQSWMKNGVPSRDLRVVKGMAVFVVLDADATCNRNVFDAGVELRKALLAEGAAEVRFIRIPGGQKSGLDDVLGARDEDDRTSYLAQLVEITKGLPKAEKPLQPAAKRPAPKKADADDLDDLDPDALFEPDGRLRVATLSRRVLDARPAALTREQRIALYSGGVYRIDGTAFITGVAELLGERYNKTSRGNAEEYTVGVLSADGVFLPERLAEPLLNCRSGMVDLRTGEIFDHDPMYLSTAQIPVDYDPEAECPTYDRWLKEVIPDQIEDLEETASLMLDPSTTPTKAIFLFGAPSCGKSTFLRLMQAVAGPENSSGVSLHQLSENKFMAAMVYGKMLNSSADLSAEHVEDLSIFKQLTGEDLIAADRKYGQTFSFTNRALFAFAANELPTVGESSGAYSKRIRPFKFPGTFEGSEDPEIEKRMMAELPGILNRWIKAYQRRTARGGHNPVDPAVMAEFEEKSDKVRRWFRVAARTVEVVGAGSAPGGQTVTQLYRAFSQWAADEGLKGLGKSKFEARLQRFEGVRLDVRNEKRVRCTNVRVVTEREAEAASKSDDSDGLAGKAGNFDPSSSTRGWDYSVTSDHDHLDTGRGTYIQGMGRSCLLCPRAEDASGLFE